MKRSHLHLLIDALLFISVLGLVLTGLLMTFTLPAGSHQSSVWGMTRHDWGDLHFWIAVGILAVGLVHLVLNWGWVCSVLAKLLRLDSAKPTLKRKLWSGLATVLAVTLLVGGFLFAADAGKVTDTQTQGRGFGAGGGMGRGQLEHEMDDLFLSEP